MKKILILVIALLALVALIACDTSVNETTGSTQKNDTTDSTQGSNTTDSSNGDSNPEDTEGLSMFKVYLEYNGKPFTETSGTPIVVTWNDGVSYVDATADENGVATAIGLDGDYRVSVKNLPSDYTYNPNIYFATNDTPEIVIEILKLGSTSGMGTSEYKRKVLKTTSVYRAELKNNSQKIYFEFKPSKSGTYTIESWVSVSDDKVNPKIDVYTNNSAAPIYLYTLDGGGSEGKYTRNFKYEVEIADEMISTGGQVVFIFAVYTNARNDKYFPATIDFAVQYEGGFELNHIQSEFMVPNELYGIMADKLKEIQAMSLEEFLAEYCPVGKEDYYEALVYPEILSIDNRTLSDGTLLNDYFNKCKPEVRDIAEEYLQSYFNEYYKDADGKTWHNPSTNIGGLSVLIGTDYRYNEATGFYHKYSESTYASDPYGYGAGYGPIVYADISTPTRTGVLDEAFTTVEYRGNKNLTVSSGTENYKFFIESYEGAQKSSQQVLKAYFIMQTF